MNYETYEATIEGPAGTATAVVMALDERDAIRQVTAWAPIQGAVSVRPVQVRRGVVVGVVSWAEPCNGCQGTGDGRAPVQKAGKDPKRAGAYGKENRRRSDQNP